MIITYFIVLQTSKQITLNHNMTPQKKKYLIAPGEVQKINIINIKSILFKSNNQQHFSLIIYQIK